MRDHMHSYTISILETCIAQVAFECPFQFVIFHVLLKVQTNSFVTNGTQFRFSALCNFLPNVDFHVPFEWVLSFEYFTANLTRVCLQCQFPFREMSQSVFATSRRFSKSFATHITLVGFVTFGFFYGMKQNMNTEKQLKMSLPLCILMCPRMLGLVAKFCEQISQVNIRLALCVVKWAFR